MNTSRFRMDRRLLMFSLLVIIMLVMLAGTAWAQEGEEPPDIAPDDIPEVEIPPVEILKEEVIPEGVNTVIQIPVSQDTFISSAFPNSNFGWMTTTRIGYDAAVYKATRILLQFDLSSIPSNVTINSAYFQYFLLESRPASDSPMGFHAQFMNSPWNEYSVTWNNANYLGGPSLSIGEVPSTTGWHANDATGAVRAWYSGARPNYGVLITGHEAPDLNRLRLFYSREQSGFFPQLIVDYTISCDTLPPVATIQALPTYSPGAFTVRWSGTDSAPIGCTPTGIAYYDVQYRVNGGAWVAWKSQTADTSGAIQSGQNGSLYEFRVRAVDRSGNAQAFVNAQAATRVDTVAPNVEVLDLEPFTFTSSFFIQWVGSDNLSGLASYDVQWRTAGGVWQMLLENTTQTAFQVTGAQNGQSYEFRARGRDVVGNVQPFSEQAQAQTTVVTYPVATVRPFNPPIVKPTDPVTDTFTVRWELVSGPTTAQETRLYYRYNRGPWLLWNAFPYPQLEAQFSWTQLGLGDGLYEFEAVASNTLGQVEPQTRAAEAAVWVDMADAIQVRVFLPLVKP